MRLIDANEFEHFEYDDDRGIEFDSPREAYIQGVEYVLRKIEEAPTVTLKMDFHCPLQNRSQDVAPIKHGKWLPTCDIDGELAYENCSVCGAQFRAEEVLDCGLYCSHCGAIMDLH